MRSLSCANLFCMHDSACTRRSTHLRQCHRPCVLSGLSTLALSTLACRQVVRTFDLEENGFTGVFPLWLVQVLATSAVPVLAELDVRSFAVPMTKEGHTLHVPLPLPRHLTMLAYDMAQAL